MSGLALLLFVGILFICIIVAILRAVLRINAIVNRLDRIIEAVKGLREGKT